MIIIEVVVFILLFFYFFYFLSFLVIGSNLQWPPNYATSTGLHWFLTDIRCTKYSLHKNIIKSMFNIATLQLQSLKLLLCTFQKRLDYLVGWSRPCIRRLCIIFAAKRSTLHRPWFHCISHNALDFQTNTGNMPVKLINNYPSAIMRMNSPVYTLIYKVARTYFRCQISLCTRAIHTGSTTTDMRPTSFCSYAVDPGSIPACNRNLFHFFVATCSSIGVCITPKNEFISLDQFYTSYHLFQLTCNIVPEFTMIASSKIMAKAWLSGSCRS